MSSYLCRNGCGMPLLAILTLSETRPWFSRVDFLVFFFLSSPSSSPSSSSNEHKWLLLLFNGRQSLFLSEEQKTISLLIRQVTLE